MWLWSLRISYCTVQFSSVQSLSRVRPFVTPWIAARQASLSITNSRSSLTSIELVMPSSYLILCPPLLLLPPIPPSIRVFSNESTFHMKWPKYWRFSFSISPSNEYPGLVDLQCYVNFCCTAKWFRYILGWPESLFEFSHILLKNPNELQLFWPTYVCGVGEGNGTPLQYSCLENPMDGGAW